MGTFSKEKFELTKVKKVFTSVKISFSFQISLVKSRGISRLGIEEKRKLCEAITDLTVTDLL